jgi:hypothetical protein
MAPPKKARPNRPRRETRRRIADRAAAHHNLGCLQWQTGQLDEAVAKLPADEREAGKQFWAEAQALLTKAGAAVQPPNDNRRPVTRCRSAARPPARQRPGARPARRGHFWRRTMAQYFKPWGAPALVLLALAAGYALPRPGRGGDMLDAVAAVQRRAPRFLISEPLPTANWAQIGTLYLCREAMTAGEADSLSKYPRHPDPRWAGVVCFRGTGDPGHFCFPGAAGGSHRCLDYGAFVVFGDPEMLEEVQAILAAEGFRPARGD